MSNQKSKKSHTKEFNKIAKSSKFSTPLQWIEKGDRFKKFTLYTDFTPTIITDRTTLVRKL